MTIRQWLSARVPPPPPQLSDRLLEVLGPRVEASSAEATDHFMSTSRALIGDILSRQRFARDGALDLLAADALMTYAFEHASEQAPDARALESLASRAAADVARLADSNG